MSGVCKPSFNTATSNAVQDDLGVGCSNRKSKVGRLNHTWKPFNKNIYLFFTLFFFLYHLYAKN